MSSPHEDYSVNVFPVSCEGNMYMYNVCMNYYFVDYENTNTDGLKGISGLDENNSVHIFYTVNADKITFGLHRRLNMSKAELRYHKVEAGQKNALDFQLASYLGYIIRENLENESHYIIVSKDTGFNSLITFWKKYRITVELVDDIASGKSIIQQKKSDTLL